VALCHAPVFPQHFNRMLRARGNRVQNVCGQLVVIRAAGQVAVIMKRDKDVGFTLNMEEVVFHAAYDAITKSVWKGSRSQKRLVYPDRRIPSSGHCMNKTIYSCQVSA